MVFLFIDSVCKSHLTGLREQQEQHAMEDHNARPEVAIRNSAVWKPLSRLFVGRPEAQDPRAVEETSCGRSVAGSLPEPVEGTQRQTCGQDSITDKDAMMSLLWLLSRVSDRGVMGDRSHSDGMIGGLDMESIGFHVSWVERAAATAQAEND